MTSSNSNCWTTDPEYIELLKYLIEKTENVKSLINMSRLAMEYKEKSGATQKHPCLLMRILGVRKMIPHFQHIDMVTKVKMMFALSAPVNEDFLKTLKINAIVEVDGNNRIAHYQAIDGSLELRGDHSLSARQRTGGFESKKNYRHFIKNYFENKENADDNSENECRKEVEDLIKFIKKKCEDVSSPLSIRQLVSDFNDHFKITRPFSTICGRITGYCQEIQNVTSVETHTKVKQLFVLSASVNPKFLKILRKDAVVEVDSFNRITKYTANDGSLTLRGYHRAVFKRNTIAKTGFGGKNKKKRVLAERDDEDVGTTQDEEEFDKEELTTRNGGVIMSTETSELIDYLIERTKDVVTPVSMTKLSKEYKEKSGVGGQTEACLRSRIQKIRSEIHSLKNIEMDTKIKMIFALSVPVNADFLKKLKKNALVDVDDRKRITRYKANDGSMELEGDHSLSAKVKTANLKSKRSLRNKINNYFKNKDDADDDSENEEKEEMDNLIEFIEKKCENINSPLNISQFARDFDNDCKTSNSFERICRKIKAYCRDIQKRDQLDTPTKVKQLFGLNAKVDPDYLEELRKDALVEVDEHNRITKYKAKDGSLELKGDHSISAKMKTAKSEHSYGTLIRNHFENKDDADVSKKTEKEKEMGNLIEFITKKCENVDSPLNICQLGRDFNEHFRISRSLYAIRFRIRMYCEEIQKLEHLDTPTKVKQLFGLSASLDSNFLEELRKEAVVEVDNLNRITKYTANDNSLTLQGDHSLGAKRKLGWIDRRKNKNATENSCDSDGDEGEDSEEQEDYSDEDSDEYSSEEFDSDIDSDNENCLEQPENQMNPSTGIDDLDYATPVRRHSPPINDSFDYDPPTERSNDTEMREEEEENYSGNTENALRFHSPSEMTIQENYDYDSATERSRKSGNTEIGEGKDNEHESEKVIEKEGAVKTGCGRSSTRRYPDSDSDSDESQISSYMLPKKQSFPEDSSVSKNHELNFDRASDTENEKPEDTKAVTTRNGRVSKKRDSDANFFENQKDTNESMSYSKNKKISLAVSTPESSIKKRKAETARANSSKRNRNDSMSSEKLDDYNPIDSNEDPPKVELQPFRGRILDNEHLIERDEDIRRIQKPYPDTQVSHDNTQIVEAPIKNEYEEVPVKEEIPMEEVKPKPAHNSKINFLEALNSLILFLDTSSLSQIQLKIKEKIEEIGGSGEVIQNNEVILSMELLIARMTNHSSSIFSETTEFLSLREFLCHLNTAILNLKIMGLDSLLEVVKCQIKDPASKNKNVPLEKVEKALQAILGDIFF